MSTPDNKASPSSCTYPPQSAQSDVAVDHATETQYDFNVNPPVDRADQARKNFERLKMEFPNFFSGAQSGSFTGGTVESVDRTGRTTIQQYPEACLSGPEIRNLFNMKLPEDTDDPTNSHSTSSRAPPRYNHRRRGRDVTPTYFPDRPPQVEYTHLPDSGFPPQDSAPVRIPHPVGSYSYTRRATTVVINGGANPESSDAQDAIALAENFFGDTSGWTVINGGEFTSFGNGRFEAKFKPGDIVRRD